MTNDDQIAKVLAAAKTIAVVGLSDKPWRPSYGVSSYMQKQGYRIIPVNPNIEASLGEKAYRRLEDMPEEIDIVNIFRKPEHVGAIVDSAIQLGVKCVWMQEGVYDHAAAGRAYAAGLTVIENRCILKYHRNQVA